MDDSEKLALAQTLLELIGHDGLLTLVAGVGGVVIAIVLVSLREIYGLLTGKGKAVDYLTHNEFQAMVAQNEKEHEEMQTAVQGLSRDLASVKTDIAVLKERINHITEMIESFLRGKQ